MHGSIESGGDAKPAIFSVVAALQVAGFFGALTMCQLRRTRRRMVWTEKPVPTAPA